MDNGDGNFTTKATETLSNVGIKAFEFYYPKWYVSQSELEKYDDVGEKYTKGLGQIEMAFCMDNEDVTSLALTVTSQLLKNYNINPASIGYLCVGTETLIDKSKSVKTALMELFEGNADIEGVDVKNACYGGTQAMFSAVDWIYANYETEKRLAIAVLVDIATYAAGPARCTGGAGAMAFLIGPQASIAFERGLRACFMANTWDFYKPLGGISTEYPQVDGELSLQSYLSAVHHCYKTYKEKCKRITHQERSLKDFLAICFHCPYYGLVKKACARIAFDDFCLKKISANVENGKLDALKKLSEESTLSKEFFTLTCSAFENVLKEKVEPNMTFNRRIGNMYTPSVYAQLISLITRLPEINAYNNERVLLFSYGSGCASAMFSVAIKLDEDTQRSEFGRMRDTAECALKRMESREKVDPQTFNAALTSRERLCQSGGPHTPTANNGQILSSLFPETYYLKHIDENFRRFYDHT